MSPPSDGDNPENLREARMSIIEHLAELRMRLIYGGIWLIVGFAISWYFREQIFAFLLVPLETGSERADMMAEMHHKDLAEPIFVFLKMCLLTGSFVGAPGIFYNVWKFVAPALYEDERRLAKPFVASATLFFFTGAAFCYYVVMPYGYDFLLQFSEHISEPQLMMQEYFAITTKLLFGFAVIFELPVFSMFLSWMGVITHRTLLDYWRIAFVCVFAAAALLTPPDVVTQMMMAGPLVLLYALSVGVAWLFSREESERQKAKGEGGSD